MIDQPRSEEDHKNIIEAGFTLVELLIVILILGILAGIVVFAVGNLTGGSSRSACATEAQTFYTAYQAFKAQNNGATPGNVNTDTSTARDAVLAALTTAGNNQFLQKTPTGLAANGFFDDAAADWTGLTAGNAQARVNAQATTRPVWIFQPSTGNVFQSNTGGNLSCG